MDKMGHDRVLIGSDVRWGLIGTHIGYRWNATGMGHNRVPIGKRIGCHRKGHNRTGLYSGIYGLIIGCHRDGT